MISPKDSSNNGLFMSNKQQLPILYEDEYILVINKPAGIAVHPGNMKGGEVTVTDHIQDKVHDPGSDRPGIVHRLDKDTSGVLVIAKNLGTKEFLQQQFKNRTVKKHYIAAVKGVPEPAHARIDVPIGRHPKNPLKRAVRANGKPAVTEYEVRKTTDNMSLIDIYPQTGRMHQIRVHLSYIGRPVLGDTLYGVSHPGLNRHFLHAAELTLTHPSTRIAATYTAGLPEELRWPEFE